MDSFPLLATALAPRKGLWCPRASRINQQPAERPRANS